MAWPTIFANLAGGTQPLALFDAMFAQVAQMIAIPCTASGQNSITLTPIGNAPTLPTYSNYNFFRFIAAQTSNGPISAQYTALANLPVYKADGVTQAGAGDQLMGQEYVYIYFQGLNAGAGGFFLENAAVPTVVPASGSTFNGLVIGNNGATPDTKVDVQLAEIVMNNTTGQSVRATTQAFTIDLGVNGAVNRLDTGAIAANKVYFIWAISNGTIVGGLASLAQNYAGLTLPAGYTFAKRIGSVRTFSGAAQLIGLIQQGRRAQYAHVGGITHDGIPLPLIGSGTTWQGVVVNGGTIAAPTWGTIPVSGFVPPTATAIGLVVVNNYNSGALAIGTMAAPNTAYSGFSSASPPPLCASVSGIATANQQMGWFALESLNIAGWGSAAGSACLCLGWEDNI